jgi:predicted transcriptional regulator
MEVLSSETVDTVIATKSAPIVVHTEQTVNQVLEELAKNKIISAPVLDLHSHKPLGFVDMLDLVWFALDLTKVQ